jgi:hypothetical protein
VHVPRMSRCKALFFTLHMTFMCHVTKYITGTDYAIMYLCPSISRPLRVVGQSDTRRGAKSDNKPTSTIWTLISRHIGTASVQQVYLAILRVVWMRANKYCRTGAAQRCSSRGAAAAAWRSTQVRPASCPRSSRRNLSQKEESTLLRTHCACALPGPRMLLVFGWHIRKTCATHEKSWTCYRLRCLGSAASSRRK